MDNDEIRCVAQAITDAHSHEPGMDCGGRLELAKSVIAAFDAIAKYRAPRGQVLMAITTDTAVSPPPADDDPIKPAYDTMLASIRAIPVLEAATAEPATAANVTALKDNRPKPKSKGK